MIYAKFVFYFIFSVFFILFPVTFYSSSAQAETEINGLNQVDLLQIKKKFPEILHENPSLAALDEVIRYLTRTESYSSIQLTEVDNKFTLTAIPLKVVRELKITGNEKIDTDDIMAAMGLKPGLKFDSGKIIDAGEKLKEYYGRHGFFNAIVSFNFEDLPNNELRVMVKIRERDPCLIDKIEIKMTDENPALKKNLLTKIRKKLNKNFTEEHTSEIESLLSEYLLDKKYLNSKLVQKEALYNSSKTKVKLVYEITDPYSYEVLLSGNLKITSGKILKQIKFEELAKGGADPGEEIAQKIRLYYIENGYAHIKLSYEDKVLKTAFIKRILIDIEEGPLVKIESLEVAGRISRESSNYADFIFENSSPMVADKIYIRSDLENGYKNLTVSLNNQGYLKAKVQSARTEYSAKKDKVRITVILDEGPLTQLTKINFYGVQAFDSKQLLAATNLENNAPLRLNALENSIVLLKKFYFNRGFIDMKLLNEDDTLVQYDEKGLHAELHFKINEGPQVFVKSIYVDGNTFTKDYVILREAGVDVGDLVTPELLDESQKRLDNLKIFSRIDVRTLEANTSLSQRTLVITVQERNPGLFKFGAGLTNKRELTARGFSSLSYNNIAGTARAVSLRGTVERNLVQENYLEYEAGISYLEPFIFNKRIRGRAGYTRSEQITGNDDEKVLATDSFKLTLEKDLTSKIKFSWLLWGFDSVEQFDLPASGPLVRESQQEIAYVGPSLDIDYRDNPFLPTTGTYTKVDGEYSAPEIGSSDKIEFVRTQGQFTHYLQLGTPKVVWANSLRAGYEKNLSNEIDSGIPTSFAFFLGGYYSVRGYTGSRGDRIPNNIEFPNENERTQLIIPGESRFYLGKSELRFPLWTEPFGGVLFYDAGQVDIQGYDFEHPIRQSFGVGIRINTPVGPISLDYARKTRTIYPRESPDQWHLSIGTF